MRHVFRTMLGICVAACCLLAASSAFAFDEEQPYPVPHDPLAPCEACHGANQCSNCHTPHGPIGYYGGPHTGFSDATDKCQTCHKMHGAKGTFKLTAGSNVKTACAACHSEKGGGVYGTIATQSLVAAGGHRIDTTNQIPGGNGSTGATATRSFKGAGGLLTCTDCHSVHDNDTVAAFYGDRRRSYRPYPLNRNEISYSNKLLLQQPTGSSIVATQYGSDWCIACHMGRASANPLHSHPVESSATVGPGAYTYNNVPVVNADSVNTTVTVLGQLGGRPNVRGSGNRGYQMPDDISPTAPRSPLQTGHLPICQQCHEDTRDVGSLSATGAAVVVPSIVSTLDGRNIADDPRFQNFPHETINDNMVVETDDDLCLNCHSLSKIP